MDNPLHPLHLTLVRQRATFSKRLLQLRCHNNRYRKSLLPQAITLSPLLPVGSPKANWSQVRGQTKYGSKYPMENRGVRRETLPRGSLGPTSGARPGRRAREQAPGGWVCHGARPGTARKSNVALLPPPSRGPTIRRRNRWGRVRCYMGGSGGDGPRWPTPGLQRLTLGAWNVTSLGGKEPELVREVGCYRLDLVGLTSTQSVGSGSKLLDRGWTLFFSGVAKGVRCWVGVGILTSPRLSAAVLAFTLVDERVASLRLSRMAVWSMRPSWRSWLGPCKGGTPWSYWGTWTHMSCSDVEGYIGKTLLTITYENLALVSVCQYAKAYKDIA